MPQSAQEWYDETRRRIAADGYRAVDWSSWPTWPFEGDLGRPRELAPPGPEPERGGANGVDCFMCTAVADDDAGYILWRDDVAMIGLPLEDISLPFTAFLMPLRHVDLSDLAPHEAARMGELQVYLERAVTDVLDVPRVQVLRYGDGQEHLHWWVVGRPTGVGQLRGTFLPWWGGVLPPRPRDELRADLAAVMTRLVTLAGGEIPGID
jgi:diadenosine tetraphosphate (Ap4A) HIT family hydrolase